VADVSSIIGQLKKERERVQKQLTGMNNPTPGTELAVNTISTQEVRQPLDSKRSFQFWNVLTDEWFQGENISGSRRLTLDKVGNEVRSKNLPKNAEIVVYCRGPKCPQSRMAAEKLAKLGYDNVRAYEGGLEAWKAAGFAAEKV
jgi:rhodanese-related sulfurtransferase